MNEVTDAGTSNRTRAAVPGSSGDAGEADQPDDRPGHRGDGIVQVELDHLDARRASPVFSTVSSTPTEPSVASSSLVDAQVRTSRTWCSRGRSRTGTPGSGRGWTPRRRGRASGSGTSTAGRPASRDADRQPAGRVRPVPLSTPASAGAALLAGEERLHDGGGALRCGTRARRAGRSRPRAVPVSARRAAPRAAAPGRRAAAAMSASQPSPEVPRPNRPARSPSADDHEVRAARPGRARRRTRRFPARGRGSRARRSRRCPGTRRAPPRGCVGIATPSGTLRVVHADVGRERVAAEQRDRVVGDRADHGDRPRPVQRQQTVVLQQHDRLLGDPAGELPVCVGIEVDRAADRRADGSARPGRARRAPATSPASSRPSSSFCRSTRRSARSTNGLVEPTGLDLVHAADRRTPWARAARRRRRRSAPLTAASPKVAGDAVQQLAGS